MTQRGMPLVGSGRGERRGGGGWWPLPKVSERDRRALADYTYSPLIARRFRIVLLVAAGWSDAAIARDLGLSSATVARWKRRFVEEGIAGLIRPRTATASTTRSDHSFGPGTTSSVEAAADARPRRHPSARSDSRRRRHESRR